VSWVVVPAAGSGRRFGGERPKQYAHIDGRPLIQWTLECLASHPRIDGLVVVIAADDPWWPGWTTLAGKPVLTATGGAERVDSVRAGLDALPNSVSSEDFVLVHDAARPCLRHADLDRLLHEGAQGCGGLLASPVGDTLKRAAADGVHIDTTVPRTSLWRALTPQMFRRGELATALAAWPRGAAPPTDEAQAMEAMGHAPRLVEGAADNLKVTTAADLALATFLLSRKETR
jgi:2-C-methyl-D-erythritol 4-phosphate cytidylyltransferase